MKEYLLYILAIIALASCANHPSHVHNAFALPDTTIISTSYHIAAVDGDQINDRYWNHVTAVYIDSVRISHVNRRDNHTSESIIDTVYAHRDTLTDVRNVIGYLPEWNRWVVKQMILNFHSPSDENCNKIVTN